MDNVFTKAKALIARRGWAKGQAQMPDGRICLAAALERSAACYTSRQNRTLFAAMRTYQPDGLPYNIGHPTSIPVWNDHPDTTLDDVNAVLDIAAKQWDADHPSD